ncbi:hypothetical protein Mapa_014224 [Marchantia paleacea]|nr:hypothetical protein Mapa_014224 [Marchantia paleacea]
MFFYASLSVTLSLHFALFTYNLRTIRDIRIHGDVASNMDPEVRRFPGTNLNTCAHIHGDIQRNPANTLRTLQSLADSGFQGHITGTQVPGYNSGILVTLIKGRNISSANRYSFRKHINIDRIIIDADFLVGIASFYLVQSQRIQHIFARVRRGGADRESGQFNILHVVLGSLGVHNQEENENSDADSENEGNESATEPGSAPTAGVSSLGLSAVKIFGNGYWRSGLILQIVIRSMRRSSGNNILLRINTICHGIVPVQST